MSRAASDVVVVLRGGFTASLDALQVGWDLEQRGFTMEPAGDKLRVQPHDRLTATDRAAIKVYRDELLAIVRYVETV
jgi:hypothetical protein